MSFALSELLAVIKLSFIFIAPAPLPTVKRPLAVIAPLEIVPAKVAFCELSKVSAAVPAGLKIMLREPSVTKLKLSLRVLMLYLSVPPLSLNLMPWSSSSEVSCNIKVGFGCATKTSPEQVMLLIFVRLRELSITVVPFILKLLTTFSS